MILHLTIALISLGLGSLFVGGPEIGKIDADDGVSISYTSEGQGELAIVFIHGWTCDHTHWRFQVSEFRKSFRVIAIDLPGHGASGANRKSWSIDGLGADVAAVVRGLSLKQVVLVGHSMGGPVALAAASKLRGVAIGVVGVDALQNVEYVSSSDATKRFVKKFEDDFEAMRTRFISGFFADRDSDILKTILDNPVKADPKAATALLFAHNTFDAKSAMVAAGVPVRAINAAAPYKTEVKINRKYGDFDAVLMTDTGHFLMLEKPVEFNRHLRAMIDQWQRR